MEKKALKIGTRGSALAIKQTILVEERLHAINPELELERVIIKTSGDWAQQDGEKRLSDIDGGKGLFAREIEEALQKGDVDFAVHSMKDMPSFLPEGLALDHVLERADARDAFLCNDYESWLDLPKGAVLGTSSMRRQSIILNKRPDLKIVTFRGNVTTRIGKMHTGQVDATLLAMAGLLRLGVEESFIHPVSISDMIPACGQAIVAIETRKDDHNMRAILDNIHHYETGLCAAAERRALQILDGSCHTPIGAHARIKNDVMLFDLFVGSCDGKQGFYESDTAKVKTKEEAEVFAESIASNLKSRLPTDIFL